MTAGTFHHALCGHLSIGIMDVFFQRTAVDADADRNVMCFAGVDDGLHIFSFPDIARIQTDLVDPGLDGSQRQPIVKVDVRH